MAPLLPPDHKPIPSPLDDLKIVAPATVATFTLYSLCPTGVGHPLHEPVVGMLQESPQPDDPLQEDYSTPASYSLERGVSSTTAPGPSFFKRDAWNVPGMFPGRSRR